MNKILVATISIILGIFVLVLIKPWISDKEQLADLAPSVFECKGNRAGEACNKLLEVGISPELLQVNARYEREVSEIVVRNKSEEMETLVDFTYQYAVLNNITLPETFTHKWPYADQISKKQRNTKQLQYLTNQCPLTLRATSLDCLELLEYGVAPGMYLSNLTYRDEIFTKAASAENNSDRSLIKDLDVYTHDFATDNGITLPESYTSLWPKLD